MSDARRYAVLCQYDPIKVQVKVTSPQSWKSGHFYPHSASYVWVLVVVVYVCVCLSVCHTPALYHK